MANEEKCDVAVIKKPVTRRNSRRTLIVPPTPQEFLDFWTKLEDYADDKNVRMWFRIINIDFDAVIQNSGLTYLQEAQKLARLYVSSDKFHIIQKLLLYVREKEPTDQHSLEYLKLLYSEEQIRYITSTEISDTKLIACAGSGKTRTILGRIKFMVEHGLAKREEVFAITFSRLAATDFQKKIQSMFPDATSFCNLKNLSTIDSLAKAILCRVKNRKSDNVEILSIALRNWLRDATIEELNLAQKIKPIKHLFVDEAQDLSSGQFEIVKLLQERFGTHIHLIGDPNQNIYQFRNSSSTYLLNFEAKQYDLTLNFRSTQQIIDFSDNLKPVPSKSKSAKGLTGPQVTLVNDTSNVIHNGILRFIKKYPKDKSNIAIICPTRGTGTYTTVGLSVIFNLLKENNIPFIQFYSESNHANYKNKKFEIKENHVNLLTYHGTKGLEFDVVFVLDFYQFLTNIQPTETDHNIHRYLLYVACSRAIRYMMICTYTDTHGGYVNHWITKIPRETYDVAANNRDKKLKIPRLDFREESKLPINGITNIIQNLTDIQLDHIDDMLNITMLDDFYTQRIYRDFTDIDRCGNESLFGTFCEELFYVQYYLSRKQEPRVLTIIELILASRFIITDTESECNTLKKFISINPTWEVYDIIKHSLPSSTNEAVEKYLDRNENMCNWIVCTNKYIHIIKDNIEEIRKTYLRYLDPHSYHFDYKKVLDDVFYLTVVQYAYETNHYFYMNNRGRDKSQLLTNDAELFEEMNKHVKTNYYGSELLIKVPVHYSKMFMHGETDFIQRREVCLGNKSIKYDTIVEIKCVKEISIKYYLQLLLYNFCYNYENRIMGKTFKNTYKIINLLTGLVHYFMIEVSPSNMFNILVIMSEAGNLTFKDLNLVYDLETTDFIQERGPNHPIFPDIMEITIKDYDTNMTIIDTMVRVTKPIHPDAFRVTGITSEMLHDKPLLSDIKKILDMKLANVDSCKLIAHNGHRFDHRIVRHYELFDTISKKREINYLDTMNLIPMHWPTDLNLDSRKQCDMYEVLFNEKYVAHRSSGDVDALMRIMRELSIAL